MGILDGIPSVKGWGDALNKQADNAYRKNWLYYLIGGLILFLVWQILF